MRTDDVIAAFERYNACKKSLVASRIDEVSGHLAELMEAKSALANAANVRTRAVVAVEDDIGRVEHQLAVLRSGRLDDEGGRLLEIMFASSHPEAARICAEYLRLRTRIESTVRATPHARRFGSEEVQGRLLARSLSESGLRTLVASRGDDVYVILDDDRYRDSEFLVVAIPNGVDDFPTCTRDEVVLARPASSIDLIEPELQLEAGIQQIVHNTDRGLWSENAITYELCLLLREDRLHPRTFRYQVGRLHVAARLWMFPQRGVSEQFFGDIGIVVERLDLNEADPRKTGIGAIEAKLRSYDDGKIHTIRPHQAENILGSFPSARIMVYDRRPLVATAYAVCLSLAHYATLRSSAREQPLPDEWVPFSGQLFRRFFLGDDLSFDKTVLDAGLARRDHFMAFGVAKVAVGEDGPTCERLLEQQTQIERRLGLSTDVAPDRSLERGRGLSRGR